MDTENLSHPPRLWVPPGACGKGDNLRVYEAIVGGSEGAGVEAAFGDNGENVASPHLALEKSRQMRAIMTRHERAASFMASGYAMYADRLGVCFVGVRPGAFDLISGLAVANPDFAAYARRCVADDYHVESLAELGDAFAWALVSNRPTVIDVKITRWALPHYSFSPKGRRARGVGADLAAIRGGLSAG